MHHFMTKNYSAQITWCIRCFVSVIWTGAATNWACTFKKYLAGDWKKHLSIVVYH